MPRLTIHKIATLERITCGGALSLAISSKQPYEVEFMSISIRMTFLAQMNVYSNAAHLCFSIGGISPVSDE